jgi:tocopherol cyclase
MPKRTGVRSYYNLAGDCERLDGSLFDVSKGAALPQKWYWTQCNSFPGYEQLSVVAGGGIRKLPFGKEEALGMVSIHYNGIFYEGVPWMGGMSWTVDTWGRWVLEGNSTMGERLFAAKVTYETSDAGLVFRAPTPKEGLVRFCRDTFDAKCTVWLWELRPTKEHLTGKTLYQRIPVIEGAISHQGGAEIGGGPWWDTWSGESRLKPPVKALLRIPGAIGRWRRRRK